MVGRLRLTAPVSAPRRACATISLALALGACSPAEPNQGFAPPIASAPADAPLAGLVDPFVGTANAGETFPGPQVPWGMASPSPHTTLTDPITFLQGTRSSSGYLHGEPRIYGFGQTHLSGVGCPDLGAPVVVPTVGEIATSPEGYGSAYADEAAHAGYYHVTLTDPGVTAELTASARVGVHRFWYPDRSGDANVLFDVGRSLSWRQGRGTVRLISDRELEGSVGVGLFCAQANAATVYFVARFDRPAVARGTWAGGAPSDASEATGRAGAFYRFATASGEPLGLVLGLSFVSTANARANLEAEVGAKSFDDLHADAARTWQAALGRIRIEGGSAAERSRFYTALYHALLQPFVASDVDGDYPTAAGSGHDASHPRYSVFSLWDSYRTVHPLLALVYPAEQLDMLRSLAGIARELGAPPKWELLGSEVNMMVGDPLPIVIADSLGKGLSDFDAQGLYAQMLAASTEPAHRPGVTDYLALGYVPMEQAAQVWGPVSTTLEYALADASLARLAAALGHDADVAALELRAHSYASLYDPGCGLLRPRWADGSWLEPFDPDATSGSKGMPETGGPGYVEGTAWSYACFVPHDTPGLIALHGTGPFTSFLQRLFDSDRFAMWNEPDLAYPYLFQYLGSEHARTEREVRAAMTRFFTDGPAGLPGNDDVGTLSAWYVLSAMGIYPDAPGVPRYALGSPLFERVEIALSPAAYPGGSFVIEAAGNGPNRPYVTAATLDGTPLGEPFVSHEAVVAGRVLTLQMGETP
jgi:predicted alpha-1,2-mannosidase